MGVERERKIMVIIRTWEKGGVGRERCHDDLKNLLCSIIIVTMMISKVCGKAGRERSSQGSLVASKPVRVTHRLLLLTSNAVTSRLSLLYYTPVLFSYQNQK